MSNNDEFNLSQWIRSVVIKRPEITLEQLQSEYDRSSSRPRDRRPEEMQPVYAAKAAICKRWGVTSIDDLPRNTDGKLNMSGMVRLFLQKVGTDKTELDAAPFFEKDGLKLSPGSFSNAKSTFLKSLESNGPEPEEALDSPDENQNNGPRARKVTGKGRKKMTKKTESEKTPAEQRRERYETMETSLDKLILEAGDLRNHDLVKVLKTARRRASAGVLSHEE